MSLLCDAVARARATPHRRPRSEDSLRDRRRGERRRRRGEVGGDRAASTVCRIGRTRHRSCARGGPRRRAAPGLRDGRSRSGRPSPSQTPRAAARLTSIPTRSISSNGPIGKPASRIAASTASTDASPASSMPERLERERPVDPVDDEARLVGRPDRGLVPRAEEPLRPLDHRRIRLGCDDDLDERHQRRRVEEVKAEDPLAVRRQRRDVGDPEGRRVRREDRVGVGLAVEGPEDVLLEGQVLERGLDHDVGLRGERDEGLGLAEAGEPAVDPVIDRVGVEIELCGATGESLANPRRPRSIASSSTS